MAARKHTYYDATDPNQLKRGPRPLIPGAYAPNAREIPLTPDAILFVTVPLHRSVTENPPSSSCEDQNGRIQQRGRMDLPSQTLTAALKYGNTWARKY